MTNAISWLLSGFCRGNQRRVSLREGARMDDRRIDPRLGDRDLDGLAVREAKGVLGGALGSYGGRGRRGGRLCPDARRRAEERRPGLTAVGGRH